MERERRRERQKRREREKDRCEEAGVNAVHKSPLSLLS
jgi:hypothetical protein